MPSGLDSTPNFRDGTLVARDWLREEHPDLAVERILDAAEKAFIEVGVSAAGMAEIAEAAGCSRGTLYRYFRNRHELHLAYVNRAAIAIHERVRANVEGIEDPRERAVEYILGTLRDVRSNPGTSSWFDPIAAGMGARMSNSSEVVGRLTSTFGHEIGGAGETGPDARLRARWVVRVIVSLLSDPGEGEEEERELVERFVAPLLVGDARR